MQRWGLRVWVLGRRGVRFSFLRQLRSPTNVCHFTDDHFFDTFNSRTCNVHPLPCNSTGACVTEEDASRVRAIGDFEYKCVQFLGCNSPRLILFFLIEVTYGTPPRTRPSTTNWHLVRVLTQSARTSHLKHLSTGVMFQELAMNFRLFQSGRETFKLRFYVGHVRGRAYDSARSSKRLSICFRRGWMDRCWNSLL